MNERGITFKDCMNRRDALDSAVVSDPEKYAWDWLKLAADFRDLGFEMNAMRCQKKAEHYFTATGPMVATALEIGGKLRVEFAE